MTTKEKAAALVMAIMENPSYEKVTWFVSSYSEEQIDNLYKALEEGKLI